MASGSIWNIPNALSLFRILAAPVLLILILQSHEFAFKWLLTASLFTDLIDGWLARRLHQVTKLGSILDSIGDSLTILIGSLGLILLHHDLFESYKWIIVSVIGLHAVQFLLSLWRYGKPSSFHTWSAKVAAFGISAFLLVTFHIGFQSWLFYFALFLLVVDAIEETILVFLVKEWKTDIRGLFDVLRDQKK